VEDLPRLRCIVTVFSEQLRQHQNVLHVLPCWYPER
jgi:hypothetical protein